MTSCDQGLPGKGVAVYRLGVPDGYSCAAERSKTGDYSEYLEDMVRAGFLARDYTWKPDTGELSKLSKYRLEDNFIRFYLRYVASNPPKTESGFFENRSLASLPAWESMLALQFESLVLNNTRRVIERLGVPLEDVVFANPFLQRATRTQTLGPRRGRPEAQPAEVAAAVIGSTGADSR